MNRFFAVALLLGLAVASQVADADVINVDFSTVMNGTPSSATASPLPYTGTTWNDVTNAGSGSVALVDSNNASTGATLSWSGANSSDTNTNTLPMLYQCIYDGANSVVVTIGGLDNSKTYNLYLASAWKDVWGAKFTVGATSEPSTGLQGSTWSPGVNYVEFAGVAPVSNQIAISFTALPGELGIFNGLQIQSVPEPSTVGLGAIGLLAVARRRRRSA